MTVLKTINYKVFNWKNEETTATQLNLQVAESTASYVVHRALVAQRATQRYGVASTKTRSEVRGGGRKPWKQKGTGRARAGSKRSPLWRGGGVIFGPRNTVNYSKKINQKEVKLALRTLLFNRKDNTKVVENFENEFEKPNTRNLVAAIESWQISLSNKLLIICTNKTKNIYLSVRNIRNVDIVNYDNLNTVDLLNAHNLLITADSLPKIEEVYND
uniref:ribosomal protein L4 n=1 Tax=Madagascaria erythrocladioides TaxID=753684 RepID=UPI001BF03110|nr:ribosomal protein L4 [Madagascaria erythrocladioides]QUE29019.1 ribosomal protein L4 [Madagascaria erythrocladioides]UNJ16571.1 ribosomal protein L4 [Madagascaria erythrocladioides]